MGRGGIKTNRRLRNALENAGLGVNEMVTRQQGKIRRGVIENPIDRTGGRY